MSEDLTRSCKGWILNFVVPGKDQVWLLNKQLFSSPCLQFATCLCFTSWGWSSRRLCCTPINTMLSIRSLIWLVLPLPGFWGGRFLSTATMWLPISSFAASSLLWSICTHAGFHTWWMPKTPAIILKPFANLRTKKNDKIKKLIYTYIFFYIY